MTTTFPREVAGYDVPAMLRSLDDFDRVQNLDLRDLSTRALYVEKVRVERALSAVHGRRYRIAMPRPAAFMSLDEWLFERLVAIDAEVRQRKARR